MTNHFESGVTYTALCGALADAARQGDDSRKERVYQAIETIRQEFPGAIVAESQLEPLPARKPWPDPTPEQLVSPEFEAIWQVIKRWDINVPDVYFGYMGATGNHVRAILDALMNASRRA